MFRIFILSIFIFSFISCYHENKETIKVPEKKLSKDQMIDILTDLQLAEGIITYRRIEKLSAKEYGEAVYNKVIVEHQITRDQLQENLDFYNEDQKLMEKIYDEVLARLNKMQSEIILEVAKLDSISKIETDSIKMLDSMYRFDSINYVLLQPQDSTLSIIDTLTNWNYKEWIKIHGFIY